MAFLFYIVLISLILLVAITTTKVKIDIINLKYARATPKNVFGKKSKSRKNIEFLIKIKVYIFQKLPIISLKIDKDKMQKIEKKKRIQKLEKKLQAKFKLYGSEIFQNIKKWDKKIVVDVINTAKNINAKITNLQLKINLGLEDVIATTFLIPIISTIITYWLRGINLSPKDNNEYKIQPLYNMENSRSQINISLKCIIEVKMIHIINIMYIKKKRKRKESKHVRTSNRRSYDYSYE